MKENRKAIIAIVVIIVALFVCVSAESIVDNLLLQLLR
jgi:hypothetical protein